MVSWRTRLEGYECSTIASCREQPLQSHAISFRTLSAFLRVTAHASQVSFFFKPPMATPRRILGEIDANRGYSNELSTQLRAKISGAYENGVSLGQIAKAYNLSKSTVQYTIKNTPTRIENTSQPRSGRPITWTDRDRRQLLRLVRANPSWTYRKVLRVISTPFSKRTIQRILEKEGITKWRGTKRPLLISGNAAKRLDFAIEYKDWDEID